MNWTRNWTLKSFKSTVFSSL